MAIENFTTYIETDPNSKLTVTAPKITYSGLNRDEEAHVRYDKGIDYFNGNFEHLEEIRITAAVDGGQCITWMLSNVVGDYKTLMNANENALAVFSVGHSGAKKIYILELDGGIEYASVLYTVTVNTTYYLKIKRDESVGTYGTIYLYIYSDAARTNLLQTLSVTLHTSKKDFRYIFGAESRDDNNPVYTISGWIENLDLQEIPPSPNLTDRNNYNGYLAFIQQYIKHKINGTTPWTNPNSAP